MKIVVSSYWGRPSKLTSRGLRTFDGRVESYLTAQLAIKTSIFIELLGALSFPAYAGSFRNNCYFANKIKADLFLLYTFGKEEYTKLLYSEKCSTGKVITEYILLDANTDFVNLLGGLRAEEIKRREPRYGMVSYLSPQIPGIIVVFPMERYFLIKKYLDLVSSRFAIYFVKSLINIKAASLPVSKGESADEHFERTVG